MQINILSVIKTKSYVRYQNGLEDCYLDKVDKEKNMVVPIPTEVIPVWYIEKWKNENAEYGSALDHFIKQLIKDWHVEEASMPN